MFKALLAVQWKWTKGAALLAFIIAFAIPLASVQSIGTREYYGRAAILYQQLGADSSLAATLNFLACIRRDEGDCPGALQLFAEAREFCVRHDHRGTLSAVLTNMGATLLRQGDLQAAETTLEEAIALCRERGSQQLLGVAMGNLALVAFRQERYGEASEYNTSALRIYAAVQALVNLPDALAMAAILESRYGEPDRAARLLSAADGLFQALDVPRPSDLISDLDAATDRTRRTLGEEIFAVRFAEGAEMDVDEAIACALEPHRSQ